MGWPERDVIPPCGEVGHRPSEGSICNDCVAAENEHARNVRRAIASAEDHLAEALVRAGFGTDVGKWDTRERAHAAFCRALNVDPARIVLEGPDGGPYTVSFRP